MYSLDMRGKTGKEVRNEYRLPDSILEKEVSIRESRIAWGLPIDDWDWGIVKSYIGIFFV